jgi:hypothetical protein
MQVSMPTAGPFEKAYRLAGPVTGEDYTRKIYLITYGDAGRIGTGSEAFSSQGLLTGIRRMGYFREYLWVYPVYARIH